MADLIIRRPRPDDHDDWLVMWNGYNVFYKRTVADEATARAWARIADGEMARGFLAELEGKLVGFVHFHYHDSNSTIEPQCYLQDLFTVPGARGKGVGRALIEALYAEADRVGAPHVYWLTQDFNATARTLYDKVANVTPFIKYAR